MTGEEEETAADAQTPVEVDGAPEEADLDEDDLDEDEEGTTGSG